MAKREKDHGFRPIVGFGPVAVNGDYLATLSDDERRRVYTWMGARAGRLIYARTEREADKRVSQSSRRRIGRL